MRNGTKNSNHHGFNLNYILAPYGMRRISGYGENVWELYNRNYDVIGMPFRLERKPSIKQLQSVAYTPDSASENDVGFYVAPFIGNDEYWNRINKLLSWKLKDGPLEINVEEIPVPHTFNK